MNQFLNQNADVIIEEMKPAAAQAISRHFKNFLNSAFLQIPLKVWLKDGQRSQSPVPEKSNCHEGFTVVGCELISIPATGQHAPRPIRQHHTKLFMQLLVYSFEASHQQSEVIPSWRGLSSVYKFQHPKILSWDIALRSGTLKRSAVSIFSLLLSSVI